MVPIKIKTNLDKLSAQVIDYLVTNNLIKQRNLPERFKNDIQPLFENYGEECYQAAIIDEGAKSHKLNVELAAKRQLISQQDAQIRELFQLGTKLFDALKNLREKTLFLWEMEQKALDAAAEQLEDNAPIE